MNITGKITGIKYKPLLCNKLTKYQFSEIEKALRSSAFILKNDSDSEFAMVVFLFSFFVKKERS